MGPHRVHVWTSGTRGRSVVLVHGIVSSRYLLPTASLLAERHMVVAPDLPGFGRSSRPQRPLGIEELADALAGVVDTFCDEPPVVVGHSIGAQVAVDLTVRRPDLVGRLVLAGPTGDPRVRSVGHLWARWMASAVREPASFNALVVREVAAIGPRRMLATAGSAVADPFVAKLERIAVPCLVVRGAADRVAPMDWAQRVAASTGAPDVTVLPSVSHSVVFSAPRSLATLVGTWAD